MVVAAPPSDALPPGTEQAFARMQASFCAGLQSRWVDIATAADDSARLAALHRLAGAAGSFGYPDLGHAAKRAEVAATQADANALRVALLALQGEVAALTQHKTTDDALPNDTFR
jgi:HPt (histidine-containing phosphotransfer) domain-containing protein